MEIGRFFRGLSHDDTIRKTFLHCLSPKKMEI
jgi:hypothetical protein